MTALRIIAFAVGAGFLGYALLCLRRGVFKDPDDGRIDAVGRATQPAQFWMFIASAVSAGAALLLLSFWPEAVLQWF